MKTQGHHIGEPTPPGASQLHARGFDTITPSDYAALIRIGIEPGEFRTMTAPEVDQVLAAADLV